MNVFFTELRRRRVFRTLALYIVGAWVIIQVAQAAFEAWSIPPESLRYVWIALVMGAPLALIFGWAYDIAPTGLVRTLPAHADESSDLSLNKTDYALLGALVMVVATIVYGVFQQVTVEPQKQEALRVATTRPAIAVLPFVDLSPDSSLTFFGNGVADALLTELGHITEIDVIARTSSFHFQDMSTSLGDIAKALGVGYVVEGSIGLEGETVHVSAKLIDARQGTQLWSGSFNGEAGQSFVAQQEIAAAVAGQLEMSIGDPRKHGGTTNFDAYKAYLRAGETDDTEVAMVFLDEALQHDPEFAIALVEKATIYYLRLWDDIGTPEDAWATAFPLLEHALSISDEVFQAYIIIGGLEIFRDNLANAETNFKQALEINPSSSWALSHLSRVYSATGRLAESIAIAERNLLLDPMETGYHIQLANRYWSNGEVERAVETFERAVELSPLNHQAWLNYAWRSVNTFDALSGFRLMAREQKAIRAAVSGGDQEGQLHHTAIRSMAVWFSFIGDFERSRVLLEMLAESNDGILLHQDLAAIAWTQNRFNDAWTESWITLDGAPRNEIVNRMIWRIALARNTGLDEVEDHYRQYWPSLFTEPPDLEGVNYDLYFGLALIARARGQQEHTLTSFDKLLEVETDDFKTQAWVMAEKGNTTGALELLEQSVQDNSFIDYKSGHPIYRHLGDEPRFLELIEAAEAQKAEQRAVVNAMIASGELSLPDAGPGR